MKRRGDANAPSSFPSQHPSTGIDAPLSSSQPFQPPNSTPRNPRQRKNANNPPPPPPPPTTAKSWLIFAIASGTCAACNGVFAKLTTTSLTSSFAHTISSNMGLSPTNPSIDILTRATFFGLNIAFNALMWALFTRALTLGSSTTRVAVVNTSANFMLTALLGWCVFGESLPSLWWVGAAGLVVGNVIIGRRDEGEGQGGMKAAKSTENDDGGLLAGGVSGAKGEMGEVSVEADEKRFGAGEDGNEDSDQVPLATAVGDSAATQGR